MQTNFVAQSPNMPNPMPKNTGMSGQECFNTHLAEIQSNPIAHAGFQKMMVRQAMQTAPLRPTAPIDNRCQLSQDGSWLPQAP